jgi:hypothetical protein
LNFFSFTKVRISESVSNLFPYDKYRSIFYSFKDFILNTLFSYKFNLGKTVKSKILDLSNKGEGTGDCIGGKVLGSLILITEIPSNK